MNPAKADRRKWHAWASVPALVVAAASLVRAVAIFDGDFEVSGFTTMSAGWRSSVLWGSAWLVLGLMCVGLAVWPRLRCWRLSTAMVGVAVPMGWAWMIYTDRHDLGQATMWTFIAIAVLIGFSWGMDTAPLERVRREGYRGAK